MSSITDAEALGELRIAVAAFEELGFKVEVTKTECGSAIINLGFRVSVAAGTIDCPLNCPTAAPRCRRALALGPRLGHLQFDPQGRHGSLKKLGGRHGNWRSSRRFRI